jgi:deoxyuridine 5'-triphosphate nucleotidohydrolase
MIKVKRLTETAILPTKAHDSDAGFDLYADEDKLIPPKGRGTISTGISISPPNIQYPGFNIYLRIAPRSGLSAKKGIDIFAGVMDFDYRGDYIVCLFNASDEPFEVKKGDKIAQIIPTIILNDKLVEVEELDETERGAKGFGSSDKK